MKNTYVDALARLVLTKDVQLLDVIPIEYLEKPSISAPLYVIEEVIK